MDDVFILHTATIYYFLAFSSISLQTTFLIIDGQTLHF